MTWGIFRPTFLMRSKTVTLPSGSKWVVTANLGLWNNQILVFSLTGVYIPVFADIYTRFELLTGTFELTSYPSTLTIP
jgi:hypothetical protein